jgi:hypothetical protein
MEPRTDSCNTKSTRRGRRETEKPKGAHRPWLLWYVTAVFLRRRLQRLFLANNKDKVIPLNTLEVNGIQKKVQLLLDSSGAKIQPFKRRIVESTTESARGIWSGLHADRPVL